MSSNVRPVMANRLAVPGVAIDVHRTPSNRRIVPDTPTAKTLPMLVPQISNSGAPDDEIMRFQDTPL